MEKKDLYNLTLLGTSKDFDGEKILFRETEKDGTRNLIVIDKTPTGDNFQLEDLGYFKSINGFMARKTLDNKYVFQHESKKIIPLKFDYAHDFDKFGFAIVIYKGKLTIINKKILNYDENNIKEYIKQIMFLTEASEFSDGIIPLAKLKYNDLTVYIDTNEEFKSFNYYNWKKTTFKYTFDFVENGHDFNSNGFALCFDKDIVLMASGYFMSIYQLCEYITEFYDEPPSFKPPHELIRYLEK